MRAFVLKSVTAATLALVPMPVFAEGPNSASPPAAGAHSPGAGGADRAVPGGGGAGGAEGRAGGEMKGDAQPDGMQRETGGNKAGGEERAPKSERPDSGDKMKSGSGDKMQKDRLQGENGRDRTGEKDRSAGERDKSEGGKSDHAGSGDRSNARSAKINSEQRTKIATSLRSGPAKRIDSVNFSIRVGTTVPRSYHYYPLPAEIIEYVPEYRGYDYILVGDQILIIDPDTGAIVDII